MNKVSLTAQGLVDSIEDLVALPEVALRIARMVGLNKAKIAPAGVAGAAAEEWKDF